MQHTPVQLPGVSFAAAVVPDMDHGGVREILGQHPAHLLQPVCLESIEHLIDEDPGWRMQHGPGERQALLFGLAQHAIPAAGLIEHGHQTIQVEPLEGLRERGGLEALDRRGVGEDLAQGARRQNEEVRGI